MDGRFVTRILGVVSLGVLAACAAPTEEKVGGDTSRVRAQAFDRNVVLDDKSMRDEDAMTAADVQKFLEKTPWGTKSVLATYEENGKTAAEIMTAAAKKHGINPLEMLVRVQMEQGLVSKKTAAASTIAIAFGCGCPHSAVCSDKYRGFGNQAECAAGTLRRSMDRAVTSTGTVSGWKRSSVKKSQDGLDVTPKNAATAALYTYTPWVGEAGGGKKGVGGVSLHHQVWGSFAEAASYGAWAVQNGETENSDEPATEGTTNGGTEGENESENEPAQTSDAGRSDSGTDAGADGSTRTDSGTADAGADAEAPEEPSEPGEAGGNTGEAPPEDGSEDDAILGEGSTPPSSNSAPPSRAKNRTPSKPEELPEASEEELASKKKAAAGCSTTGTSGGTSNALLVVGAAVLALGGRRRKSER